MKEEYYVLDNGEKTGPYTYDELIDLDIDIHTQIIISSSDESQYASEIPELNEYFESKGIYFPTQDNLANFGIRVAAFLIDYFALYFILFNVETNMGLVTIPAELKFGTVPDALWTFVWSFLGVFFLYKFILEATPLKGTIGKKVCGLIVVDIDGKTISTLSSLGRNLGVMLSLTIWVPFLSMLMSEHRQNWYDSLAKTYVIKRS